MKRQCLVMMILLTLIAVSLQGIDSKFIRVISQTKTPIANAIKINDQYAYVYNDWYLYIYSLKNPWSPQIETAYITTFPITDVLSLDYNHIFICTHEPTNEITEIDSMNTFGRIYLAQKLICNKARREGAMLYTTSTEKGLQIFDIGKGLMPQLVSTFSEKWGIIDMEAKYPVVHALNDFGYVNIDITDLAQPRTNGTNYEIVKGSVISVNRNIAWVGAASTLIAVDITYPDKPVILNRYRFSYDINDIKARGDEIFVALKYSGLKILNIANPKNIIEKNSFPFKTAIRSVAVEGDFIYLAANTAGWIILEYR
jgi:hypothetical protein